MELRAEQATEYPRAVAAPRNDDDTAVVVAGRSLRRLALALVAVVALAACGSDSPPTSDLPDDDATVITPDESNPWVIVRNVDRFPNVASICSPFQDGYRLYVLSQTDTAKAPPVVVADPKCTTKGPIG